jgi:hypothetical protein
LYFLIAVVLAFAAHYVVTYVPAGGNGSDFQVFYSAAMADKQGVNPFNWSALWPVQQQLFNGGIGHSQPFAFAPYIDPPPTALLLRPLTVIAESSAYRVWAALLICCGALGAFLIAHDWPRRSRLIATGLVTLCPAALFDLRLGQNSTPLLLALGAAVYMIDRGKPFRGGLCLGCGLFKPHLMGPIAVVVLLATPRRYRKYAAMGVSVTGGFSVLIGLLFDGGPSVYLHWLGALRQLGDAISYQPDLASVSGLYQGSTVSGLLNILTLVAAAGIIFLLARRIHSTKMCVDRDILGWGTAVYLALSPYVHTSDQILLAPALISLVGPHGYGLRDRAVLLATWTVLLAPMVVIRDYHTTGINALPPIAVAFAYWMQARPTTKSTRVVHG